MYILETDTLRSAYIDYNATIKGTIISSCISILGIIISENIAYLIVKKQIFNSNLSSKDQIINSNINLNKQMKRNRIDQYENSLHVYIFKKLDYITNDLSAIVAKAALISSSSKAILDTLSSISKLNDHNMMSYVECLDDKFLKIYSTKINSYIYKFLIIQESLINLGDFSSEDKTFKHINNGISKLNKLVVTNQNVLLGKELNSEKGLVTKIYKYTHEIELVSQNLIIEITIINQRHTFKERNIDIRDKWRKYLKN